jgi:hypothetical protein
VRAIKVTYRAIFEQPIGALNPMGLKLSGDVPVEVFHTSGGWQARAISRIPSAFTRLGKFLNANIAKSEVANAFDHQVRDWQLWGIVPVPRTGEVVTEERMLSPDEIIIDIHGKAFFKQAEDYTHIIHAQTIPPGARIPPAACGAQVNGKCFISTKANVEPSCKGCAEVWKKEYRGK